MPHGRGELTGHPEFAGASCVVSSSAKGALVGVTVEQHQQNFLDALLKRCLIHDLVCPLCLRAQIILDCAQ